MPSPEPPLLQELPYGPSGAELFGTLAGRPWAVLLDSGRPDSSHGRFDILSCDPMATLVTRGDWTEIHDRHGKRRSREDPFALLQSSLGPAAPDAAVGLPFGGGALGCFGYDLGRRLERLPELAAPGDGLPELAVGIYDWALVVDHDERRTWLVGQGRDPRTRERWARLVANFGAGPSTETGPACRALGPLQAGFSYPEYAARFARIQRYIQDGDCYQVNFAQRFTLAVTGDPWASYLELRRLNPAPFGAYLNLPGGQVLSASPERFLHLREGVVETRPIKGTCPRDPDPERDRERAAELQASPKNRAENLMIVDLLRNDLGKTCAPGSIQVPGLFELESFASVHHLVSTVRGRLASGRSTLDLLRGCFPGGSITGAPKIRAMQIIEELEPHRRGVYCGSIGYLGFDGAMDSNIAIRTLVLSGGQASFWAGGGIVADSTAKAEYLETLDKAAPLFRLFGQEAALRELEAAAGPGAIATGR
jgi:para-aminobenzoate synthetase component 1